MSLTAAQRRWAEKRKLDSRCRTCGSTGSVFTRCHDCGGRDIEHLSHQEQAERGMAVSWCGNNIIGRKSLNRGGSA